VKTLWEHRSGKLGFEYRLKRHRRAFKKHRDWTTIQDEIENEWKQVCKRERSNFDERVDDFTELWKRELSRVD